MIEWLVNIHLALVIIVIFRLLTRDSLSPGKRISWIMVTAVAPILGILLYLLVGETRRGLKINMRIKWLVSELADRSPRILGDLSLLDAHVEEVYRAPFRYANSINGFAPTTGNRATLQVVEPDNISGLVADIDAANEKVLVLTYIWLEDHTGKNVAEALMRAARRGLEVRAIADGLGSRAFIHSICWQQMKEAGVKLSIAQPFPNIIKTILLSRIDLRNHRKLVVIDRSITYVGSRNLADAAFAIKKNYAPWVDITVRFEGPIAIHNQLVFGSDWLLQEESGNITEFADNPVTATPPQDRGVLAQVWADGPTERDNATQQMFTTLLLSAQNKIIVSTPYFVPSETVLSALCAAALRGVEIVLILPRRNDSWIVAAASHAYYHQMLNSGLHIYEYEGGLLHAKTVTVDGVLSMIGSSNIDLRSFDLNYENNVLLYDRALTADITGRQQEYLASSVPVTIDEVTRWSLRKRVWSNVVATVGPVL